MHRMRLRPIKVFVTTRSGTKSYLVEDNNIFEAALPFIRRFHGMGYSKTIKANTQNKLMTIMVSEKTTDAVMISSYRLY